MSFWCNGTTILSHQLLPVFRFSLQQPIFYIASRFFPKTPKLFLKGKQWLPCQKKQQTFIFLYPSWHFRRFKTVTTVTTFSFLKHTFFLVAEARRFPVFLSAALATPWLPLLQSRKWLKFLKALYSTLAPFLEVLIYRL